MLFPEMKLLFFGLKKQPETPKKQEVSNQVSLWRNH